MYRALSVALTSLALAGCVGVSDDSDSSNTTAQALPSPVPAHQRNSAWYRDAAAKVAAARGGAGAKNVILFLGDGMGVSTVTAARIYQGQLAGNPGEENRLSFEEFPVTGLAKTYNVDAQTPDSAGTMSAIVTGVKTDRGVFGIDEAVERGNCASGKGRELLSLLSLAELAGKRTGVVTTARLTHATPAATYAATAERDWEDDSEIPAAERAQGCLDIASQFVAHRETLNRRFGAGSSDGIEVALGGGRRNFLPADKGGRRTDGKNLIEEWQLAYPMGSYVDDRETLAAADATPVLGLFADSHIDYALKRQEPGNTQPSLVEMTEQAIAMLDGEDGYLLVVEAGRIDHAHHAGNAANALNETAELSDAVAATLAMVDVDDTLVIVTADHSHVFTMAGYPRRGNPILGKVVPVGSDEPALDANGLPYTTLGYMNGRGFADYGDEADANRRYKDDEATGRVDISNIDTTAPGYHQEALIPAVYSDSGSVSETHGGEDVAVYARGPGAAAAAGVNEQNLLFHVMLNATTWEADAAARIAKGR